MQKNWRLGGAVVGAAIVLGLGWWLGSPLFSDKMANEAAPGMIQKGMAQDEMMPAGDMAPAEKMPADNMAEEEMMSADDMAEDEMMP